MHRKVTQPGFAGGNRRCRPSHVAQHECGQQRKTGQGDRDEGHHIVHDLGARLLRRPGEASDGVAIGSIEFVSEVAWSVWDLCSTLRRFVSRSCAAMLASASLSMNLTDMIIGGGPSPDAEVSSARANGHCRDDGRTAHQLANDRRF